MPGRLNVSCAADGVIAYQDTENVNTFHYFPARIDAVEDETLIDFSVKYYGINKDPYWADLGNRNYQSVVGGLVSGQAVADITKSQRDAITKEIRRIFKLKDKDEVNLVPLVLKDVEVQPIFAQSIVEMGNNSGTTFPKNFQIGTQFGFNISSGNSLFTELVGSEGSIDRQTSPDIGVNFYGNAELRADKWIAKFEADLSQVWKYTRDKVSASVKLGWINIAGAEYDKIVQELIKTNIVKVTYIEGGGGKEFGRALLESSKALFEAINAQVTSGEGIFKFEPNPKPQEPSEGKDSLGGELLPWALNLNMSFGRESFTQKIAFEQTITFEGNVDVAYNGNMSLALTCNAKTAKYFYDLQTTREGCITAEKRAGLQSRIKTETGAKDKKVLLYMGKVESGEWDTKKFAEMLAVLNTINLTESTDVIQQQDGTTILIRVSEEEASARFDAMIEAHFNKLPALTVSLGNVGTVFPPDGRTRVENTKIAPWNAIGQLVVTFPDNSVATATGTLIGERHVITAAHVLYQEQYGGRAKSVVFYPGRNSPVDPFGSYAMTRFDIDDEFIGTSRFPDYDYGLITLRDKVQPGHATFTLRNASDEVLKDLVVRIAGYPGDKPAGTLWQASGKLTEVRQKSLRYMISTFGGQSGSALASAGDGPAWDIFGIHSKGGVDSNAACRVTDRVIANVKAWKARTTVALEVAECDCGQAVV